MLDYEFSVLLFCTLNSALELRIREEGCGGSSHFHAISSAFEISEDPLRYSLSPTQILVTQTNLLIFSFGSSYVLFKDGVDIEVYIKLNNMVMNESERIWTEATMHSPACRIYFHGCYVKKYNVKLT